LGRLGGTPYHLAAIDAVIEGTPFVPSSWLNDLRRHAVTELQSLQTRRQPMTINKASVPISDLHPVATQPRPQLHLLVRTPEQLDAAIDARPASITLDYLDLYGLRPAVERVVSTGITARVASPRVLKPDEQRIVGFLLGLECGIVVRSSGLLLALTDCGADVSQFIGDFSLNAANVLTARAFLELGIQRLTPAHDLNAAQTADLARAIGADKLEVIAYQHLPVFHTEHCVFCRFLSTGTSYEDCGRPCEKHRVALRDAEGREHPVIADVGCRNTVFGAQAQ
jgi:putative protease